MNEYDINEVNRLCEDIDLIAHVEDEYGLELQKRGDKYFGNCPLHIDKTPSLCFYPEENCFYCYSCKRHGNLLTWLTEYEKVPFTDAINKIYEITGNKPSLPCSSAKIFREINKINNRNTHEEKRKKYSLDYFTKYSKEYPQEWIDEGIPREILDKYEIRIDHESNRIVYPLYDNDGNLVGVKGRTRWKNWKAMGIGSKYMAYNSFGRTDFFVGMKQNRDNIIETGEAIIVEGIKSVMKLDNFGYHNGLAAETSTINDEQIKILLALGVKNVVIALDKGVDFSKIAKPLNILKRFTNVYIIRDYKGLLDDKDAPVDKGKEIWEKLYDEKRRVK